MKVTELFSIPLLAPEVPLAERIRKLQEEHAVKFTESAVNGIRFSNGSGQKILAGERLICTVRFDKGISPEGVWRSMNRNPEYELARIEDFLALLPYPACNKRILGSVIVCAGALFASSTNEGGEVPIAILGYRSKEHRVNMVSARVEVATNAPFLVVKVA